MKLTRVIAITVLCLALSLPLWLLKLCAQFVEWVASYCLAIVGGWLEGDA